MFEQLGDRQLDAITQADLIAVIKPLVAATPETARRIKQRLTSIFAAAAFEGLIAASPAAQLGSKQAKKVLGEARRDKEHLAALASEAVPGFLIRLREYGDALLGTGQSLCARFALEFALLTAARTNEVLGMQWQEIDDAAGTWTVPPDTMKGGEPHMVFLAAPARAILITMKELTGGEGYVFPSPADRARPLSNMALLMILRRLKTGGIRDDGEPEHYGDLTTVHGLCRAAFSTWAYQGGVARGDVIECVLAHREADRVKAAYSRTDPQSFAAERRKLLASWAAFITQTSREKCVATGEVIDLESRRA